MEQKKEELLSPQILEERARILSQQTILSAELSENLIQHPHVLFECAGEKFALPLKRILELVSHPQVASIPGTPPALAGVINLRGVMVDIIYLDILLGLASLKRRNRKHIIICEKEHDSFGLWVDQVIRIISLAPEAVEMMPDSLGREAKKYVQGVARHGLGGKEIIALLDLEKIFSSSHFDLVRE